MKFYNRNALKDARWDAEHKLGNRNQYNPGSMSWTMYEWLYTKLTSSP